MQTVCTPTFFSVEEKIGISFANLQISEVYCRAFDVNLKTIESQDTFSCLQVLCGVSCVSLDRWWTQWGCFFYFISSFSTSRELSGVSRWSLALALEFASGVLHVSPLSPPNTLEAFGLTYLCHQSTASTRCLQISETIVSLTNWQRSFHRSSVTAEPVLLIRSEVGTVSIKGGFSTDTVLLWICRA